MQSAVTTTTITASPAAKPKAANRRAHRILSNLILLMSVSAVILTVLATTSGDVVLQVLSQTELVPQEKGNTTQKFVTVREPYGYVSIKDDTGKAGFWRFLSSAAFYEYRLPRAFLKISQHRENLTHEESEELQFMAGVRKRPKGWEPSKNRNVFLDEPYRDKTADRLFKRSHRKINTSLVVGFLSLIGLLVVIGQIIPPNQQSKHTIISLLQRIGTACCKLPRLWVSNLAGSPTWNNIIFSMMAILPALLFAALVSGITVAAVAAASAITVLVRNDDFCGHKCASSAPDITKELLEVDACIEFCVLGNGGKFAMTASALWFLVLFLVGTVSVVSAVSMVPPLSSSLAGRRWWNVMCLPLAIRPDELHPLALPLSYDHYRQRSR